MSVSWLRQGVVCICSCQLLSHPCRPWPCQRPENSPMAHMHTHVLICTHDAFDLGSEQEEPCRQDKTVLPGGACESRAGAGGGRGVHWMHRTGKPLRPPATPACSLHPAGADGAHPQLPSPPSPLWAGSLFLGRAREPPALSKTPSSLFAALRREVHHTALDPFVVSHPYL